jgi:hypothetical protein
MQSTSLDVSKYTVDKHGVIRFDYLFSYWIFTWFIVYIFITPTNPYTIYFKKYCNPIFAFIIGIVENLATLVLILIYKPNPVAILKFISMMIFAKIIPAIVLWSYPIHWVQNIVWTVALFLIYNVYLTANQTNLITIYKKAITSIIHERDLTPLYALLRIKK